MLRPSLVQWMGYVQSLGGIFTIKRVFHLPRGDEVQWLKTEGMLREPFAKPLCIRFDLKPGFEYSEFVH